MTDLISRAALCDLLALPDPIDLRSPISGRGHVRTVDGTPDRFEQLPRLATSFVAWRLLSRENERTA